MLVSSDRKLRNIDAENMYVLTRTGAIEKNTVIAINAIKGFINDHDVVKIKK